MKKVRNRLVAAIGLLFTFMLWTIIICFIDVQPIGPLDSSVGLASINRFVHDLTGTNFALYYITDWLGCVPIVVCIGFGMLGLIQWVRRKSLYRVDSSILLLGVFYIITIGVYFLFEQIAVNHRPVLINGCLEPSYPSSTTLLVMCVMPTAILQFNHRIKRRRLRNLVVFATISYIAFMVIGRFLSGVHWFSDIIGGVLLSTGLVLLYDSACRAKPN